MSYIASDECIDDLQIKGFGIIQKKNGFKFGIDAVILSDFAAHGAGFSSVLDLCTGTGIVPVLLCAKTDAAFVRGVEIQPDIADMAKRSVRMNALTSRAEIIEGDLRNIREIFPKASFDAVTCNPPYMEAGRSLQNTADTKAISRHEICCTLDDVTAAAAAMLRQGGHFYMIHRPSRLADIMCSLRAHALEPKRLRLVYPNFAKPANLVLIDSTRGGGRELKMMKPLAVFNPDGTYTEEINSIYGRKLTIDN